MHCPARHTYSTWHAHVFLRAAVLTEVYEHKLLGVGRVGAVVLPQERAEGLIVSRDVDALVGGGAGADGDPVAGREGVGEARASVWESRGSGNKVWEEGSSE